MYTVKLQVISYKEKSLKKQLQQQVIDVSIQITNIVHFK